MTRRDAVRAGLGRSVVGIALAVAVVAAPANALAATAPSPTATAAATTGTTAATPSPVPTADPLSSALAASDRVAAQVAQAQAAYAAATAHLTTVQGQLSAAVAAYGAAQDALGARTVEADKADMDAAVAATESATADLALRRQAALMYQGSPTDSYLAALFGPNGPQGLSDLQIGMAAVLARQDDARVKALALASDAARSSDNADAARVAQAKVADAAKAARAALQAVVARAQADATKLADEQDALLAELASLRAGSVALEQQREDQLAALAGLPAGTTSAASLARLYASGGGADLTRAQLDPRTVARAMLLADGFGASQWPCLEQMWNAESGWNWSAANAASGAYGIPQALPGSKMASAGPDWLVNPVTQIRWGLNYIESRYGSPCTAWSIWQTRSPHWY